MSTWIDDDEDEETPLSIVFYAPIIAILVMIIALIVKLLWNWNEDVGYGEEATESSGLLSYKDEESLYSSYGTSEEDLESCNNNINNNSKGSCSSSYSSSGDDLYDGTICAICYDEQRSCFFVPCGHCITCYTCANRIISEEIKTCPICRTSIIKIMKLHIS
ncbi:hypothetical protein ABFX02_08G053800 [Erythranthe guttata]